MNEEDLSVTSPKRSLFQQSSIVLIARGYSIGLIFLQTIIYISIVGIDDSVKFRLTTTGVFQAGRE